MDFAEPLLIVIDPKSNKVIDRIPLKDQTKGAYKPYFSPDRGTLIAISENPAVADIFDAHHLRGPQTVISVGKAPMGVAFSADGRTALIANHGDGSVSIIDLKESKLVRSFPAGTGIETLTWY
jgi:DNA-binding beta-propeller fold protein YncE